MQRHCPFRKDMNYLGLLNHTDKQDQILRRLWRSRSVQLTIITTTFFFLLPHNYHFKNVHTLHFYHCFYAYIHTTRLNCSRCRHRSAPKSGFSRIECNHHTAIFSKRRKIGAWCSDRCDTCICVSIFLPILSVHVSAVWPAGFERGQIQIYYIFFTTQ